MIPTQEFTNRIAKDSWDYSNLEYIFKIAEACELDI